MPANPQSEQELLARAYAMAGLTLAQLAATAGIQVPQDLRRDKGWTGQLIEWQLGASAGSRPEQDFPELGIELKTIPVDPQGRPLETTFVCVAPLIGISGQRWEESNVRNKLSRVLWIPVEGSREIPVGERRVGMPLLWSPSEEEEQLLRQARPSHAASPQGGQQQGPDPGHRPQRPADPDAAPWLLSEDRLHLPAAAAPFCPPRLILVINILVIRWYKNNQRYFLRSQ